MLFFDLGPEFNLKIQHPYRKKCMYRIILQLTKIKIPLAIEKKKIKYPDTNLTKKMQKPYKDFFM